MSHFTKLTVKLSQELILKTLESLDIKYQLDQDQISFVINAYGEEWQTNFLKQMNSDHFDYSGESDFYAYEFLPAYVKAQVDEQMRQLSEHAGTVVNKVEEYDRSKGATVIKYQTSLGRTISFVIKSHDNITIQTEGFSGNNCLAATEAIMNSLGTIQSQVMTNEGADDPDATQYDFVIY